MGIFIHICVRYSLMACVMTLMLCPIRLDHTDTSHAGTSHAAAASLYENIPAQTQDPLQQEIRGTITPPSFDTAPQAGQPAHDVSPVSSLSAAEVEAATQAAEMQEAISAFEAKEYDKAYTLWHTLAQKGHGGAMNRLGLLYDKGHGVTLNSKKALGWFRKSAETNNPDGMYNLGRLLEQGRGTPRHVDSAAVWFRKAADMNQAAAQYNLGRLYERGEGVVKNDQHAAAWYSLAATSDNVEAQARLGHLYHMGKGVPQNLERATLLLYGATMRGHAIARDELLSLAASHYGDKGLPRVTLFGAELSNTDGVRRAAMRATLAVSKVKSIRENDAFVCDVYDLTKSVPGATQMAACYGNTQEKKGDNSLQTAQSQQPLGFLQIDYTAPTKAQADAIVAMVQQRFGTPSAGENANAHLWNLGNVIVATQYLPELGQVGLMYMMPHVYHLTVSQDD